MSKSPHPVQHKEKIRGYFDDRMEEYDGFYKPRNAAHALFNRSFRRPVYLRRAKVLELASRYNIRSVLDVGCGSGRNTLWWAHEGIEKLHGVDISSEMIQEAQQNAAASGVADRATFELADFMSWDTDERFDMVVACGVFDYVVDSEAFLRQMSRFARHVIYGSFPGWTLVRSPLRKLRYSLRGCPTHFYRRRDVDRTFTSVGFGANEAEAISGGYSAWSHRR